MQQKAGKVKAKQQRKSQQMENTKSLAERINAVTTVIMINVNKFTSFIKNGNYIF